MSEHRAIARWARQIERSTGVHTGPGDDVAWIAGPSRLAVSVDTVVEGVHFRFDWSSPVDVGWRAVGAALSDLAACRAHPVGLLVALSVPAAELAEGRRADGIMQGVRAASRAHGAPLLGGDTVASEGPVSVSVTVLGAGERPLLRSGARPGDQLQVSGPLGLAALAVRELEQERTPPDEALRAHRRPLPRLDLLPSLDEASAGIDISDGLLADAAHLARCSDVTLRLHRDACLALGPEPDPSLALSGGDDYQLLVTAPLLLAGFVRIGEVEAGPGRLLWSDGRQIPAAGRGWDHGASR